MSGFSLSQALPSNLNPTKNDGLQKLLQLPDSLCTVSTTHVLSSSFCSLIHKVKHFKQFLTATPPPLLPISHLPFFVLFDELSYSAIDSLGFRGLTFIKRPSDKVCAFAYYVTLGRIITKAIPVLRRCTLVNDVIYCTCSNSDHLASANHLVLSCVPL